MLTVVTEGLTQTTPAPSFTTTTTTIWLMGGTAGTTTQGRIFERSFTVNVQEL